MKKLLFFTFLIMLTGRASAQQSFSLKFDHQALVVDDLDESARFYSEILGLKEIKNQTGNANIRWFTLADEIELHLIQRDKSGIQLNKNVHFALAVSDFDAFVESMEAKKVAYENWPGERSASNVRPDGIRQVYIQDPDGYWIEVNDAKRFD